MLSRLQLATHAIRKPMQTRAMASKASSFVKYNWQDPLNLESQLTEEEVMVR